MPYVETVKRIIEVWGGKEYPVTITKRKGLHTHTYPNGETALTDEVTITDAGPKLGTSVAVQHHIAYTDEQRTAGRKLLEEAVNRVNRDMGIW